MRLKCTVFLIVVEYLSQIDFSEIHLRILNHFILVASIINNSAYIEYYYSCIFISLINKKYEQTLLMLKEINYRFVKFIY